MTAQVLGFDALKSDEVLLQGMLASDVRSLWRRLARTAEVGDVARGLASQPERISALARYLEDLLDEPHDRAYRHPNDIAICAGLIILEQSPLADPRHLFSRLRRCERPSLVWVRRMAEHCQDRYIDSTRTVTRFAAEAVSQTVPERPIEKRLSPICSGTHSKRFDLAAA